MKTQYFTKVENKFVFNVSLIFWHLFIVLSALALMVGLAFFAWSLIPPTQRNVEKQAYPEMSKIPDPVKVSFNELDLVSVKQSEVLPDIEQVTTPVDKAKSTIIENKEGKSEYDASLATLKTLIPPSKYSWTGSGYYTYPYGERYWDVYKQEKYRQWFSTESGVEDKLNITYKISKADSYLNKKRLLDAYIQLLKLLPEDKRLKVLQNLMENNTGDFNQNAEIAQSLIKMATKMPNGESTSYIQQLASFSKRNPVNGSEFINYLSSIIEKFASPSKSGIVEVLINSYSNHFNKNLNKQKEATDLFIPLIAQVKDGLKIKALNQYYGLYLSKNYERDMEIAAIESAYQQQINEIDNQYNLSQASAVMEYQSIKLVKQQLRLKSLMGAGASILIIVLIGTILVFLSIQRSVSKIEEIISTKSGL